MKDEDEPEQPIHPLLRNLIIVALVVGIGFYAWVAVQARWP